MNNIQIIASIFVTLLAAMTTALIVVQKFPHNLLAIITGLLTIVAGYISFVDIGANNRG